MNQLDDSDLHEPLIDSLVREADGLIHIGFVPEDDKSRNPKESIRLSEREDPADFKSVDEACEVLAELLGHRDKKITEIWDGGGGDFTFKFKDGSRVLLSDAVEHGVDAMQVYFALQNFGKLVQVMFVARRNRARAKSA